MSHRIQPDSPEAQLIHEEERLHARVQTRAAEGGQEEGERVNSEDFDAQLIELRDAIAEAKPEDLAPLVEQMTRLAAIRSRLGGSRVLPIDTNSPYFAHMRLRERGKSRDVLIGKRGFIDRKSNVQIVDWRNAPISQVYYRYEEGDDFDEEIAGRRMEGLVEVRRNVSIARGRLRRIGAPQGTFVRDSQNVWHGAVGQAAPVLQGGQGKAARAAGEKPRPTRRGGIGRGTLGVHHGDIHRADKHMPEIAALIDKEQFDLITQPEGGLVVIQGGAGSGKTTVALHRIAYLTFADSRRFKPKRILFVVPSEALVRYVKDVLPSLGVHGVPVVTYADWARNTRLRLLRGSGKHYNEATPDVVSRLKKHPAMLAILADYADEQTAEARQELGDLLDENGPAAEVLHAFDTVEAGRLDALVPRLRRAESRLREIQLRLPPPLRQSLQSSLRRLRERAVDVLTDWSELLTDAPRLKAGFSAHAGLGDAVSESEIDKLVHWCMQQYLDENDSEGEADKVATADGRALNEGNIGGRYDVEDDPIILRLIQLKRGALVNSSGDRAEYEHVAIDEAQDRSALEVKVLLEATVPQNGDARQRSVTIAGDTAQRVVFDNGFDGWESLLQYTGHAAAVVRPLNLSYRSTAEVMELAREILGPELAPMEPLIARSGAPVELHEFGDIGEAVAFMGDALRTLMAREPTASVAVIARYPEQADVYYAGLRRSEVPSLRRVRRHDFSFEPGVDVTDISQVKGLEFDYVLMTDVTAVSYPATVESRHLLHIGATRAAHQLWLIPAGEPSILLPDRLREIGFAISSPASQSLADPVATAATIGDGGTRPGSDPQGVSEAAAPVATAADGAVKPQTPG